MFANTLIDAPYKNSSGYFRDFSTAAKHNIKVCRITDMMTLRYKNSAPTHSNLMMFTSVHVFQLHPDLFPDF